MRFRVPQLRPLLLFFCLHALTASAATFGTLVPVRGTVGDLALDERRNRLYVASLAGYRIDVMDTQTRTMGPPILLAKPPSSVALSADNRFLVVGYYDTFPGMTAPGGITIFDLDVEGRRLDFTLPNPVLAVGFGNGSRALVVTTDGAMLVEPLSGEMTPIATQSYASTPLPVPFGTFPQKIVTASLNVSGDGNTLMVLASTEVGGTANIVIRHRVNEDVLSFGGITSSPALGPRSISLNADGSRFLAGWMLIDSGFHMLAEFPYPAGDLRVGGHAFDHRRDAIYAHVPVNPKESPVLHVMDTDNLTVRERIQLPRMLAGRTVFSRDMDTLYALSDNGILVLPVGRLATAPRVVSGQADLLFQGDACNRQVITQFLDLADPSGAAVDFQISVPGNAAGIRISTTSGMTPARIRIDVDPTAFQNAKGTTTIPLTITSARAVNIPDQVRLLINTRDVNQRGRIVNVPGKLVDILSDTDRNRIYLLRQDKNIVQVHDGSNLRLLANLRTGNTPVRMAISEDKRYLLVGNDHSHLISVFDLETLAPAEPFWTPNLFVATIGGGRGALFATARPSGGGADVLMRLDLANRIATPIPSLGIFQNTVPATSTLIETPSRNYMLLATPAGAVALWEADTDRWVVSRTDLTSLGGPVAAFSDNLFAAGSDLLDESLYPVGSLASPTTAAAGFGLLGDGAVQVSVGGVAAPGLIERFDPFSRRLFGGTLTIEAPHTATSLKTPDAGQIGQTILPFTRVVAVTPDQLSILQISQAGLSLLPANFDAASIPPVISSVVNSADGQPGIAPGGLITISGNGFSNSTATAAPPLPSTLGDVCVTVSNVALPLIRVSASQIAAQLPFTVTGSAPMIIRNPGGISAPFAVNIAAGAPAIFRNGMAGDQTGLPSVIRQKNNEILNFTNPVHPNEKITIVLTGLGRTSPEPVLGDRAPADPLSLVTFQPEVTIGDVPLQIDFAGLVPGQVGVYQIDATVPGSITDAAQIPLTIRQGAISTSIPVRVVTP